MYSNTSYEHSISTNWVHKFSHHWQGHISTSWQAYLYTDIASQKLYTIVTTEQANALEYMHLHAHTKNVKLLHHKVL